MKKDQIYQPLIAAQRNNPSHALVIGGSIAGLLAARVLADHFDRVTIVDRDRFPSQPEWRPGVPQSHHVHALMSGGQQILEQLFPGLTAELANAGAPEVDWTADCQALVLGGWAPCFTSGIVTRPCSRNLLEWLIRRRLAANSNVRFLEECQVTSLLSDTSNTSVTGVQVSCCSASERDSDATAARAWQDMPIPAQLVVDASGRTSKAPKWLETLGYAPPQETVVNSFLGYASRWFKRPTGFQADWKALVIMSKYPDSKRSCTLYPVEGDRWVVTVGGIGRDYPPTDPDGFLDFARNLRTPIIYEAIKDAEPLSPVYGYRRTENRRLHYEQLSRMPENFVVIGDAACAFNPIYGQGMTVAALGALTLDKCLKDQSQRQPTGNLIGLTRSFQKQLAKVNASPWLAATGEDFRWPTTEGGQPDLIARLMHWYGDEVMLLSIERPEVYKAWAEAIHMIKPPSSLFHPSILIPILRRAISRSLIPASSEIKYPKTAVSGH